MTSTPSANRVRWMVHSWIMRAFTLPIRVRRFRDTPLTGFQEEEISGRQSALHVAACTFARTVDQSLPAACATNSSARARQSLPQSGSPPKPGSAVTARPNHPLPRQDLHLQACQRPKVAHKKSLFARPFVRSAARVNAGVDFPATAVNFKQAALCALLAT